MGGGKKAAARDRSKDRHRVRALQLLLPGHKWDHRFKRNEWWGDVRRGRKRHRTPEGEGGSRPLTLTVASPNSKHQWLKTEGEDNKYSSRRVQRASGDGRDHFSKRMSTFERASKQSIQPGISLRKKTNQGLKRR